MNDRDLLATALVAVLATVRPDGRAHAVPVVFATHHDMLYSAIDHKPKSTTRLARLDNIRSNPQVSVLAHHYEDDWQQLWWVRVDGTAAILDDTEQRQAAIGRLVAKYPQYQERAPVGPVIAVRIERIASWRAEPKKEPG